MGKLKIGDKHEGGIIFYLDETGHGLIASPQDLSGTADWEEAMQYCDEYSNDGVTGWRLPDTDELNLLFLQKENIGEYIKFSYWSSTVYADHFAWFQDFNTGTRDNDFKDNTCYVRAVKNF
ncbi:MAG: DUF1566 domain-containing protein [Ferruginibacter sp.]